MAYPKQTDDTEFRSSNPNLKTNFKVVQAPSSKARCRKTGKYIGMGEYKLCIADTFTVKNKWNKSSREVNWDMSYSAEVGAEVLKKLIDKLENDYELLLRSIGRRKGIHELRRKVRNFILR